MVSCQQLSVANDYDYFHKNDNVLSLTKSPLLKIFQEIPLSQKQLNMESPVDGPTVFTDSSEKPEKAAVT